MLLGTQSHYPAPGHEDLVAVLRSIRPLEAQLSGFSDHQPCTTGKLGNPSRCVSPKQDLLLSFGELGKELTDSHALGVWHLVWAGNGHAASVKHALEALERAALKAPNDARVLTDLSAAYLVAADAESDPLALVQSLEAVDRALLAGPDLEAALFNRALILTRLSLQAEAASAWETFLATSPFSSPWTSEARERYHALQSERENGWSRAAAKLSDKPVFAAVEMATFASSFPQEVTSYAEMEGLAAWAASVLDGKNPEANQIVTAIRRLGQSLSEATGDPMIVDTASAIEDIAPQRLPELARAVQSWIQAMKLYEQREVEAAAKLFAGAEVSLKIAVPPLAFWSTFYRAICVSYSGDRALAKHIFAELRREAIASEYVRAQAYLDWMTGYIAVEEGDLSAGIKSYRAAVSRLEVMGYRGLSAFVRSLVADAVLRIGESRGAMSHLYPALVEISRSASPKQRQVAFWTMANAIAASGHPKAALYFYERSLSDAKESGLPIAVIEASYARAEIRHRLGDIAGARRDLEEARRWLAGIQDPKIYRMCAARIAQVESIVRGRREPAESLKLVAKALEHFELADVAVFLPGLYLQSARRRLELGDLLSAEGDYLSAIDAAESQRALIKESEWRVSFAATARNAIEDLVILRLELGHRPEKILPWTDLLRDTGAFALGERLERAKNVWNSIEAMNIPEKVALVSFSVFRHRLVIWVVSAGQMRLEVVDVSREDLEAKVAEAAKFSRPPSETREARVWLYEQLVAPIADALMDIDVLYLAPDLFLHRLPFSALIDPVSGRYLIQRYSIATTPSAALLLASSKQDTRHLRLRERSILAVGNPQPDTALEPLKLAEAEAQEVAALHAARNRKLLLGDDATRENVLRFIGQADFFYFAGHALSNPKHPEFSRLVLAGNSHEQPSGLYAWEIRQLDLKRTELVVLSACGTAWSRQDDPSGVLSLAAPFLMSGAKAVVATLDDVDSQSAYRLSTILHKKVLSGIPLAQALRATQLQLLASAERVSEEKPGDYEWASFRIITTQYL